MSDLPIDIFGTKYRIREQLADKGSRKTLLARDTENDTLVVIKLLTFNNDFRWEDLKLFEREAETLKSLSHPAIPQYLDYLEIDSPEIKGFALVQSYIEAPSLAQQITAGRTFSEAEVKQIARQILEILDYLHSRQPQVIHRDIKPSNILIANRSGNNIGQIYLVDFGSVQNVATKNTSTLTVVGTYGYMPPEQFSGRAKPASDIYSLGATIIYLVTGEHPADLPETDLKIEFEEYCNLSAGFTYWLKQITNPSLSQRVCSTKQAIESLQKSFIKHQKKENFVQNKKFKKPNKSKVILKKNSRLLRINIKPAGLISVTFLINIFYCLIFGSVIIGINYLRINSESSQLISIIANITTELILAFCLGMSITFFFKLLLGIFGKMELRIDTKKIHLTYYLMGIKRYSPSPVSRKQIIRIEKHKLNLHANSHLEIVTRQDNYLISGNPQFPLSSSEIDWLSYELSNWLDIPLVETQSHNDTNLEIQNFYLEQLSYRLKIKDYQNLLLECDRILEKHPQFDQAYFYRGIAKINVEKYEEAIEDYNQAIAISPKVPEFYNNLAHAYLALKDHENTIIFSNLAIELKPQLSQAYYLKSLAYYNLEKYDLCLQSCNDAIKLNFQTGEVFSIRGLLYTYLGDLEAALADFERQLALNKTANAYYNIGVTQIELKLNSRALENFSQCIELDSQFKFAYYARANIYYAQNDRDAALQDYQTATELEATVSDTNHRRDEHAYYARGLARYQIGKDIDGAIKDIEKAQEIATQHQYTEFVEKAIATLEEINKC